MTTPPPHNQAEPLVSVLVPAYKHEKYVIACLESIRNLDYPHLELILSDDCSSDSTFPLAEQWIQEHRGRFARALAIRQQPNVGLIRNLQFLFDQAQGEFIVYLGSDDLLTENSVRDRIAILLQRPEIDGVIGNSDLIDASGAMLKTRRIPPRIARHLLRQASLLGGLLEYWNLTCASPLIRRSALAPAGRIGPLPVDIMIEDRYVFIRLAAQKALAYVDSVILQYRRAEASLSQSPHLGFLSVLQCDEKNEKLARGLDRTLLRIKIASCAAGMNRTSALGYYLRKIALKIAFRALYLIPCYWPE